MDKNEVRKQAQMMAADPDIETLLVVGIKRDGSSRSFMSAFHNSALVCQALVSAGALTINPTIAFQDPTPAQDVFVKGEGQS